MGFVSLTGQTVCDLWEHIRGHFMYSCILTRLAQYNNYDQAIYVCVSLCAQIYIDCNLCYHIPSKATFHRITEQSHSHAAAYRQIFINARAFVFLELKSDRIWVRVTLTAIRTHHHGIYLM